MAKRVTECLNGFDGADPADLVLDPSVRSLCAFCAFLRLLSLGFDLLARFFFAFFAAIHIVSPLWCIDRLRVVA